MDRYMASCKASAKVLAEHNVSFSSKSGGKKLVVSHNGKVADFWPGTGDWCIRGAGFGPRGVFQLLDAIQ